MRLLNFDICSNSYAHSISAFGNEWDLHNLAHFQELVYDFKRNLIILNWTIDYATSPWGAPKEFVNVNKLSILFNKPNIIFISPSNNHFKQNENDCLLGISKIIPMELNSFIMPKYRTKIEWNGEIYNLLFVFQSGLSFEIGAESAELKLKRQI